MLDTRISEIYNEFQNFPPKNGIVRNNIREDAYTIYVFETLFYPYHNIRKFEHNNSEHRALLLKSIVPPPDDQIDIFLEDNTLDEKSYHIVQVKNSNLSPSDIETSLTMMESTINTYCKNPKSIRKNLKEVISETDFSKDDKSNCIYYVVHKGNIKSVRNQKKNCTILNFSDLEIIKQGSKNDCVPLANITIDTINNFIINNFLENKEADKSHEPSNNKPKSLLCNFNGYDLAQLNNQYATSLAGRNILYGQNLRESLSNKSKTYGSMFDTINNEPDLFLFYNNGITILCSDFDAKSNQGKENITLKNFSIINGAQTTSTLGEYLKEALAYDDQTKIEKLKRVFVLTKIYEINSSLKEHKKIGENIRIFTNTQTPLSNRDMVSIKLEQIKVQRRFIEDFKSPNIFITIKNGEKAPDHPQFLPYQIISNERLAQLCFAGPLLDPFTAKDKRSKLFNVEQSDSITLNPLYHKIFDEKDGILFKMTNIELDELLFIYKLHEDTKKYHKEKLHDQIIKLTQDPSINEIDKKSRDVRVEQVKRFAEISAVFIFHNISAYYLLKRNFDSTIEFPTKLIFNSKAYYNDKSFREQVIESFLDLVYTRSIEVIANNSGIGNIQNWTRSSPEADTFIKKFEEELVLKGYKIAPEYKKFIALTKYSNTL